MATITVRALRSGCSFLEVIVFYLMTVCIKENCIKFYIVSYTHIEERHFYMCVLFEDNLMGTTISPVEIS